MSELTQQEVITFRVLRKTAVILMLILRLDRPVGESEISRILEINPKTVRMQLESLATIGMITRTAYHNGYTLTLLGKQLALPVSFNEASTSHILPSESLTTTAINIVDIEVNQQAVEEERQPGKNYRVREKRQNTPPEPEFIPNNPLFQENLDEMKRAGIRPNKTIFEIADMEHINPRYIRNMAADSKRKHQVTGLLITRLKQGDPEPEETIIPGSEADCRRFASSALFEINA